MSVEEERMGKRNSTLLCWFLNFLWLAGLFFTKTNQNTSGIASSDVVSELQPQNRKGKSAVCSVRSGRFTINILSKTAS